MAKILIVDDSKIITHSLQSLLKLPGHDCDIANSLEQTKQLLEKATDYQVALLDLSLPDAPNGEVVDYVKKFDIPIVVLTGSESYEDEKTFREKEIVDYVIKDGSFAIDYAASIALRIIANATTEILVVDDSLVSRSYIKDMLELYNINCLVAEDGVQALKMFEKHNDIKIVITDYNMPNMNGLELTRAIRTQHKKSDVAIIVTSADTKKRLPEKFIKSGANGFLYKGFSKEKLYLTISQSLELLDMFQHVQDKANKDFMTGMYNRRYFFDEGVGLFKRSVKKSVPVCVSMIDIDKFKNINDTYGHDIGDVAIQEVAIILDKHLDTKDSLIARFGGEEFCIIHTGKSVEEVHEKLEEIRKDFEQNILKTQKADIQYTVSIGYTNQIMPLLDDMVNNSDKALYTAKNGGRNQVQLYK